MTAGPVLLDRATDVPRLYLACPLTNLSPLAKTTVCATVDSIKSRIDQLTVRERVDGEQWPLAVYAPLDHTAPWKNDGLGPATIYERNLTEVLDSDAMVVVGGNVVSAGVGQEVTWASTAGLPILYLTPGPEVSRQIAGTPGRLEIAQYGDDWETLGMRLDGWLRRHRALIEDGPRRRDDRRLRYLGVTLRLRAAWTTNTDRTGVAVRCNLYPAVVDSVLQDPARVALMPTEWLDLLSAELGVAKPSAGPQLGIRALRAWITVTEKQKLDDSTAERLRTLALFELLHEPSLDLDTLANWQEVLARMRA